MQLLKQVNGIILLTLSPEEHIILAEAELRLGPDALERMLNGWFRDRRDSIVKTLIAKYDGLSDSKRERILQILGEP